MKIICDKLSNNLKILGEGGVDITKHLGIEKLDIKLRHDELVKVEMVLIVE